MLFSEFAHLWFFRKKLFCVGGANFTHPPHFSGKKLFILG